MTSPAPGYEDPTSSQQPETAPSAPPIEVSDGALGEQQAKAHNMRGILRTGLEVIGPDRRRLFGLVALALVVSAIEVAVLFLVARLALALAGDADGIQINLIGDDGPELSSGTALAIGGGLVVLLVLLSIPLGTMTGSISSRALYRLRYGTLQAYLRASWAGRATDPEGHLQELMGVYAIYAERLVMQVTTMVVALCGAAALGVGAVLVSPVVAFLALIGLIAVGSLLLPLARRVQRAILWYQRRNKDLSSEVAQTARVAQEIAVFGVADDVADVMMSPIGATSSAVHRIRFGQRTTPLFYVDGALAMVLGLIAVLTWGSASRVSAVGPVILLLVRSLGYLKQFQTAVQSGREFAPFAEALEAETARLDASPRPTGSLKVRHIEELRFEHVGFAYGQNPPVFDDVDVVLRQGEAVGLVGPSGAGKSTFSQLVLRLQEPTKGRILVNDAPLSEIQAECWSGLVAFVPQDNDLIRADVAENIRFYRQGVSDEQVRWAARAAHLHDEIEALPNGYATMVGPGERNLSGGQMQRLGIARAVLGRPELLVLDEPTSALDQHSEVAVRETLHELKGETTLLIIAHRLSTLEICDRILQVENGHVVSSDPVAHT